MKPFINPFEDVKIESPFWKGGIYGLIILIILIAGVVGYHFRTGINPILMAFAWMVSTLFTFPLIATLVKWFHLKLISALPRSFSYGLVTAIITYSSFRYFRSHLPNTFFDFDSIIYLQIGGIIYFIFNVVLLGCIWYLIDRSFTKEKQRRLSILTICLILVADIYGTYWLASEGSAFKPVNTTIYGRKIVKNNEIEDPSKPGTYKYDCFTYGSSTDSKRKEFSEVRFTTPTVDASILLPEWKGDKAKWRKRYWGFGVKEFPLNSRVWFPKGDGSFPLILIVHGNHSMEYHSDPGYAYLGEQLASRGFITASIDENFINGTWSGDFRGKEMPARAWVIA